MARNRHSYNLGQALVSGLGSFAQGFAGGFIPAQRAAQQRAFEAQQARAREEAAEKRQTRRMQFSVAAPEQRAQMVFSPRQMIDWRYGQEGIRSQQESAAGRAAAAAAAAAKLRRAIELESMARKHGYTKEIKELEGRARLAAAKESSRSGAKTAYARGRVQEKAAREQELWDRTSEKPWEPGDLAPAQGLEQRGVNYRGLKHGPGRVQANPRFRTPEQLEQSARIAAQFKRATQVLQNFDRWVQENGVNDIPPQMVQEAEAARRLLQGSQAQMPAPAAAPPPAFDTFNAWLEAYRAKHGEPSDDVALDWQNHPV